MLKNRNKIRRYLKAPVVAGIASAALTASVVGGVAIAQSSTPAVITACVAENSGNVRIVSSANDCRPNETSTAWNQQGPSGPQGPQGEPGQAGPARFVDTVQGGNYQQDCATRVSSWNDCAAATIHVPANKTYVVGIDSAGSFYSESASTVLICTSARRVSDPFGGFFFSQCRNQPTGLSLDPGKLGNAATNGVNRLTGGTSGTDWIISTAVLPTQPLPPNPNAVIHTLVTVSEVP